MQAASISLFQMVPSLCGVLVPLCFLACVVCSQLFQMVPSLCGVLVPLSASLPVWLVPSCSKWCPPSLGVLVPLCFIACVICSQLLQMVPSIFGGSPTLCFIACVISSQLFQMVPSLCGGSPTLCFIACVILYPAVLTDALPLWGVTSASFIACVICTQLFWLMPSLCFIASLPVWLPVDLYPADALPLWDQFHSLLHCLCVCSQRFRPSSNPRRQR